MKTARFWLGLGVLSLTFSACSEQNYSPEELPYSYEVTKEFEGPIFPYDLDNDQVDELIRLSIPYDAFSGYETSNITIFTAEGHIVDQVNFYGILLEPFFLDWRDDGVTEIFLPILRNDSLSVHILDAKGKIESSIFLTKGKPRIENDSVLSWDPTILNFYLLDLTSDGKVELVSVINTGYARQPRGVFVHSFPEGQLLGDVNIGAALKNEFLDDFDGDGKYEILASTAATNNGADTAGFSDDRSYLINFNADLPPTIKWSKEFTVQWSRIIMFYDDFNNDQQKELLFTIWGLESHKSTTFEFIDLRTMNKSVQRVFNEQVVVKNVLDTDRDLKLEVLAVNGAGEVLILDRQFEIIRRNKMKYLLYYVDSVKDLDGDGLPEIIVRTDKGRLILGADLKLKCRIPFDNAQHHPKTLSERFARTGNSDPVIIFNNPKSATMIRLKENPYYLFYRYGKPSLAVLAALSVFSLIFGFVAYRGRYRKLRSVQETTIESDRRGVVLLHTDGRIQSYNSSFARLFDLSEDKAFTNKELVEIVKLPELAAFLRTAAQHPTQRQDAKFFFDREGMQQTIRVALEPVNLGLSKKPLWLLTFVNQTRENEYLKARSWRIMSQRIAHDVKNSLSGIQLTSQRMQLEYQDRIPRDLQNSLDEYTTRNIDQIDNLRRVTRNFMKLVDLEKPNLQSCDFGKLMRAECGRLKTELPLDITLHTHLASESVTVKIDQEQFHELLKNLVSNAVNAMPDGGVVTVTTQIERKLYLANAAEPQDFAVIEVKDTGCGVPVGKLDEIFELSYTTSENGSGLGLAIVKKIIDLHDAHIEVESQIDAGTVFTIYLPASD